MKVNISKEQNNMEYESKQVINDPMYDYIVGKYFFARELRFKHSGFWEPDPSDKEFLDCITKPMTVPKEA